MCGIAGYRGTAPPDDERVAAALALMARRGPDHREARRFPGRDGQALLLHARLSIIDLEDRSNQPLRIGRKWIAFNGELYNYLELRRDLEAEGRRFATASDTEVLLAALDAWGWDALDRCEGMWAFALYDEENGSLALCRDRFGEKPLYLQRSDAGVHFGSEIKFVTALSGCRPAVDVDHLLRYLVNGYKALYKQPACFFRGIEEVPPATVVRFDAAGRETRWRYWMPRLGPETDMTYAEAVEGTRARLVEAVRLRLRADVPLAFCLSGGVDSNALIGIARRVVGADVHGFTIVNADERYEEMAFVEETVRALALRHTAVRPGPEDFLTRLRMLVRQHDAPVYTISYYVHWLLMGAMADAGFRISISGTGADELFSGYYDHHNAYLYEMRAEPAAFEEALGNWRRHVAPIVRNPVLRDPLVFLGDSGERGHIYLDAPDFAACLRRPWFEPFTEARFRPGLLRNRMLNELFHEVVPVILHEDDRNAMHRSIENRSPFLDRALFEFTQRIPTRHLVRDGMAKAVLRDAVRGIVPDAVLDNRRKVGFNAPVEDLLDTGDPAVMRWLTDDSPIYEHVARDRIAELLERRHHENSTGKFLFNFVNAKIFLEEFAA